MRRVVLVCGPPASGKSTWVAEQASDGDAVIDFDRICRELGSPGRFDHPKDVKDRAHALRAALERQVAGMGSGTAWVIRSAADPAQRRSLADSLRATETVVITTPAEQAHARAAADDRPAWTGTAIDRWWSAYQPDASRLERELSLSEPQEGYPNMPDETAETEQGGTVAEEEVTETEEVDATEPEGDSDAGGEDEPNAKPQEGKQADAFDAKRAQEKIRKANQEAAGLRKRLKELEPLAKRAQEAEDAQKTEVERLQERLDAAEKRGAQFRGRAVKSEVRSMAADLFADKTDPEALLDLDAYIGDDGEIDSDRIKTDLEDLLERKPHLAKPKPDSTQQRRKPAPDRTQASGANQPRAKNAADEFAGFVQSRLLKGKR